MKKRGIFNCMRFLRTAEKRDKRLLHFSEKSEYSSADMKFIGSHIEILLQPGNKKLIIYLDELLKIVNAYIKLMGRKCLKEIDGLFNRILKRRHWIHRNYFELASLLNLLLTTTNMSNSNASARLEKLRSAHETAARVLKNYRKKLYRIFLQMDGAKGDSEQIRKSLIRTAGFVHQELISVHRTYERYESVRGLLKGILKEYHIIT